MPIQSPGTSTNVSAAQLAALATTPIISAPASVTADQAKTSPLVLTAKPGTSVSYSIASSGGAGTVAGNVTMGATGSVLLQIDLTRLRDGTLTYSAAIGTNAPATATGLLDTQVPPAPSVSVPTYANAATQTSVPLTVTGQAGAFVLYWITDGSLTTSGSGFLSSAGVLSTTLDLSRFADGTISFQVTQMDTAGNVSVAAMPTLIKDTKAPAAPVLTLPAGINLSNQSAAPLTISGEAGATAAYTVSDGAHAVSGSALVGSAGSVSVSLNLSTLADGTLTATASLTDPARNVGPAGTTTATKSAVRPATPTVALNPASDSGASSSDYVTNVNTPQFAVGNASGTTAAVYVNGVAYTGQKLADGSYTVTATATDQAGNTSAAATAPKTLVIDTAAPAGSFTVSGAKSIAGQLSTSSKAPTLALSFTDAGTGIAAMALSTDGGTTYSATQAYASSAAVSLAGGDGLYTIAVKLVDVAGNTATFTQAVRLDTTGPTISASLSAPQSATLGYDGTANFTISSSATDVSGVASTTLKLDSLTTIAATTATINVYSLTAGPHTLVVTSFDGLGNSSSVTLTFQVHPSLAGVVAAVKAGAGAASISSAEQTKLLGYLNNTANPVKTNLTNFLNEVKAQSGTSSITAAEATLLTSWAQDLYNRS
jgi:hypothetical protein